MHRSLSYLVYLVVHFPYHQKIISPFVPFTGYTGRVKNDGSKLARNESNEQNASSAKSPRSVDKKTVDKLNERVNTDDNPATKEVSASNTIGQKVTAASSDKDSAVQTIKNDVDNFVKKISAIREGIQAWHYCCY